MAPFGAALLAYHEGSESAALLIRRDDGREDLIPLSHFFRGPGAFSKIEVQALSHCRGLVLDIGGGSGLHSLYLQRLGLDVTAIDITPEAVQVMSSRGVRDARQADFAKFNDGRYDTLLLLGHGIGIAEDLAGIDAFLAHASALTATSGQILVHSRDVTRTQDPAHLAYHEKNRRLGRYPGEIRFQFEFEGHAGPYCGWLHIDPQTLGGEASKAGWDSEVLLEGPDGEYLSRLIARGD
jgi:SAM-dependent methyltransferase